MQRSRGVNIEHEVGTEPSAAPPITSESTFSLDHKVGGTKGDGV